MNGESDPAIADDEMMNRSVTREMREFFIVNFTIFSCEIAKNFGILFISILRSQF